MLIYLVDGLNFGIDEPIKLGFVHLSASARQSAFFQVHPRCHSDKRSPAKSFHIFNFLCDSNVAGFIHGLHPGWVWDGNRTNPFKGIPCMV